MKCAVLFLKLLCIFYHQKLATHKAHSMPLGFQLSAHVLPHWYFFQLWLVWKMAIMSIYFLKSNLNIFPKISLNIQFCLKLLCVNLKIE